MALLSKEKTSGALPHPAHLPGSALMSAPAAIRNVRPGWNALAIAYLARCNQTLTGAPVAICILNHRTPWRASAAVTVQQYISLATIAHYTIAVSKQGLARGNAARAIDALSCRIRNGTDVVARSAIVDICV